MGNIITMARDSLTSLVSRMGTDRDKASTVYYTQPVMNDEQLVAAYRGSWLPRKIVDIPALDSCRKWRDWQADQDVIGLIEGEEKRLNVKGKVLEASKKARLFGGAALYIGTGDNDPTRPLQPEKVGKGGLKYLTVLTRCHLTAGEIEDAPESEWHGKPKDYSLTSKSGAIVTIHPSRLVIFEGAMFPDEKFNSGLGQGWGESVLVSTLDAIKNADSTAGNIASLVFEAKVDVIRIPNFMASLGSEVYKSQIIERYTLANMSKGINGTLILDKEEEYETKSAQLAGLTDILMAFMQIVSGAADIPVTRLLGQSPAGMNSTGTSDMKNYYDRVQSIQELELAPAMARLDECLIRSATGSRDPSIYYEWAPLEQMSEKERADIFKIKSDAARALIGTAPGQEIITREALSDAMVNAFIEDGSLPGLEGFVDEYGKLSEQEPSEEEQAAALAAQPAQQGAQQQQAGNGQITADALPRTLYVSRKVLNGADIIAWAKGQGFTSTLPAEDMHVTIAYSRTPVDWMKVDEDWNSSDKGDIRIAPGGPRVVERLGDATVLSFQSWRLSYRHSAIKEAGASWDYPEYQPHISVAYDGAPADLSKVEPYQGEIHLGPEIFTEIEEDWHNNVTEA